MQPTQKQGGGGLIRISETTLPPHQKNQIFILWQKATVEGDRWISLGREFQTFGAMIQMALSQSSTHLAPDGVATPGSLEMKGVVG